MNTNRLEQLSDAANEALVKGLTTFESELKYFDAAEEMPDEVRAAADMEAQTTYYWQSEVVKYLIATIRGYDIDEYKVTLPAHFGPYRNSLLKPEGQERKDMALQMLTRIPEFKDFTADDAAGAWFEVHLHHLFISNQGRIRKRHLCKWQSGKNSAQVAEFRAAFTGIQADFKTAFDLMFTPMLRECRTNVISTTDTTSRGEITKLYNLAFEQLIEGVINNKNIVRVIDAYGDHDEVKRAISGKHWNIKQWNPQQQHNDNPVEIELSSQRPSYFFYVYMADTLFQTIAAIERIKSETITEQPAATTKADELIQQINAPQEQNTSLFEPTEPPKQKVRCYSLYYYYIHATTDTHFEQHPAGKLAAIKEAAQLHGISYKNLQVEYNKAAHPQYGKAERQQGTAANAEHLKDVIEMLKSAPAAQQAAISDYKTVQNKLN